MRLHLLDYVLWLTSPVLLLGAWVAMYRRGLYRQYPWFFNYIVFQAVCMPVALALSRWSEFYYFYFTNAALSSLLSFAVLHDVLKNGFQPSGAMAKLSSFLLAATLVVVVVTEVSSIYNHDSSGIDSAYLIFLTARTVRIAQCIVLILMFAGRKSLGISRRNLLFGIMLGLGLSVTVPMLLTVTAVYHAFWGARTWSRVNAAVYLLACGIWLAYAIAGSGREHAYSWRRVVPS